MADYRDAQITYGGVGGKAPPPRKRRESNTELGYWWQAPEGEAHEAVCAAGKFLLEQQRPLQAAYLRHARLYGNFDYVGLGLRSYAQSSSWAQAVPNRIALNAIASCVDTHVAKIGKNKPRPFFLTKGGDWKLQRRAKGLNRFSEGIFYEGKAYREGKKVLNDADVFGTGCLKVVEVNKRIRFERTLPWEVLVDDADGKYGSPRQMFQTTAYPREVLMGLYRHDAEKVEAIKNAPKAEEVGAHRGFGDMVQVFEAWHLPSSPDADDGKHMLAIDTCLLSDDTEWTKDHFPFAFMRFSERLVGFYGQGIAERLTGKQVEINRMLRSVSEQMQRKGRGRVFVQIGSKVTPSHLTNGVADLVFYTGQKPIVDNANAVASEEMQQIQYLWQMCFEEIGISALSASMQKPSGLDSRVALREYNDIESERFVMNGQGYEDLYLDANRIAISMARDIAMANGGQYLVRVPGKRHVDFVDWKNVNIDADSSEMKCFPVSSLPTNPAAKRQEIQEYINAGWIEPLEGRALMELPDLERSDNLATARLEDADWLINKALDDEEAPALDDFSDAQLVVSRGIATFLYAKQQGAPPEALEALQNLIDDAAERIAALNEPPAQAPMLPADAGGMPPEAAMPPGAMPPGMDPTQAPMQ